MLFNILLVSVLLVFGIRIAMATDLLIFPIVKDYSSVADQNTSCCLEKITTDHSSLLLVPIHASLNMLLHEDFVSTNRTVGYITSWLQIDAFRFIGQLLRDRERVQYKAVAGYAIPADLHNGGSVDYPDSVNPKIILLLKAHRLKRVAILARRIDCEKENVIDLVSEIDSHQGMHVAVYCLQEKPVLGIYEIWYALQRAIDLKLTSIVLVLPPEDSMRVIDIAASLNLLFDTYTWLVLNLNKSHLSTLRNSYPNFEVNNILWEQIFNNTKAHALMLKNIYDTEYLKSRDESLLRNYLSYNVYPTELHHHAHRRKQVENKNALRFVTLPYSPLVTILKHIPNVLGHCDVGMPCHVPVGMTTTSPTQWVPMCCSGLILEILENVIKDMNIDYYLYVVEDGSFGGFQNGTWTGIINDVYTGKADVGVQAMSQLNQRLDYVDFTVPILGSWFGIIRQSDVSKLKAINWIFLTHLQLDLCIAIVVVFCLNFGVAFLFENTLRRVVEMKGYHSRDMFSYLSGLLFQRDLGPKHPQFWSSRVPCISYAIAMTIIMTTYAANLTAKNLVYDDSDDFIGLSDRRLTHPTDDFKFTVMGRTSYELYMRKKPNIYNFIKHRLVPSDVIGVNQVLTGSLDGYIGDWTFLKYLTQLPQFCHKLKLYKETKKSIFSAFIVPKNSPWKDPFSQQILNIFETKTMEKLLKRWLWYAKCEQTENEAGSFAWRYFGGLFIFTSASIVLSLVILIFENCVHRFGRKSDIM